MISAYIKTVDHRIDPIMISDGAILNHRIATNKISDKHGAIPNHGISTNRISAY
jgi:hypothetical protein